MTTREFLKEHSMNITFNITLIISIILRYTGILEKGNKSLVIILIIFLVSFIIVKLFNKLLLKQNLLGNVLEEKSKRKYKRFINWSYILIVVIVIFGR
ncbi:hypothetical protein [Gottfriedia acidiceleris]|uniref:Uncharacterized protein n=1 Tax=Gottfriedia acidiceleris TaxID=371036 RepID=A0ABY4JRZ7_9BACI|nr:hypothetical protein [Gottfriedia acidiceleris]UPM56094.1 hypothetical protein MY490_09775 [Gottfriedia acidiceleris]